MSASPGSAAEQKHRSIFLTKVRTPAGKAAALDDLVCFTFEGRTVHPDTVTDVEIREPLRSWLLARAPMPPVATS